MKSRSGAFGLVAMLIVLAIIAILKTTGGNDGKSADQAMIAAGDRAVANMIPSCPESPDSCDSARYAPLAAQALRRAGLQPGACMSCREETGGVLLAEIHGPGGDYAWQQFPDGRIIAKPAGAAAGEPGLTGLPVPPSTEAGGGE